MGHVPPPARGEGGKNTQASSELKRSSAGTAMVDQALRGAGKYEKPRSEYDSYLRSPVQLLARLEPTI